MGHYDEAYEAQAQLEFSRRKKEYEQSLQNFRNMTCPVRDHFVESRWKEISDYLMARCYEYRNAE